MRRTAAAAWVALLLASACSGGQPEQQAGSPVPPAVVGSASSTPSPAPSATPSPTPPPTPECEPGSPVPPPSDGTAPRVTGPLHVCGEATVNEGGRAVRLLGVAYSGLEQGQGLPDVAGDQTYGCPGWKAPREVDYDNMEEGGFNVVRLAISWANLEPDAPTEGDGGAQVHDYDDRYLAALDAAVGDVTDRGLAVVLDMHQVRWSPAFHDLPVYSGDRTFCQGSGMPAWLYPNGGGVEEMVAAERAFFMGEAPEAEQGLIDAWTFLVDRYADEPLVVGIDILNEAYDLLTAPYPGVEDLGPVDFGLAEFYERVGGVIQEANPDLLLFYEDNVSRRTGLFSLTRQPDLDNGVYAAHFYQEAWDDVAEARVNKYRVRAVYWGVPMWISEMTRFALNEEWNDSLTATVGYLRGQDIGWAIWSYRSDWFEDGGGQPGILDVLRSGF